MLVWYSRWLYEGHAIIGYVGLMNYNVTALLLIFLHYVPRLALRKEGWFQGSRFVWSLLGITQACTNGSKSESSYRVLNS